MLPLPGWPRAVFESNYLYDGGRLLLNDEVIVDAADRGDLESGIRTQMPITHEPLDLQLTTTAGGATEIAINVDGRRARREDRLRARPAPSAWVHASLALAASGAGFIASYLYLLRSAEQESEWAMKMAYHMAGWHLLLTFTLFPISLWGGRAGIRLVQFVCMLFFFIHLGIALANFGAESGGHTGSIALFNGLSGIFFLAAGIYGNRAHRDMDPVAALRQGRARE